MSKSPLVSVIVSVYNAEKYLVRCLDSILEQQFKDLEIICVDNSSTDSSLDILHTYAEKDSRIKVITQENRGPSGSRNTGLENASGEWVAFIDCDDTFLPGIFETLLPPAQDEDAIWFGVEEVAESQHGIRKIESGYFDVPREGESLLSDEELVHMSMTIWNKFYRRAKIEAYAIRFPEGIGFEDNVFTLNFFAVNRKVRFCRERFYRYIRRENSYTSKAKQGEEGLAFHYINLLEPIHDFWRVNKLLPKMSKEFERICFFRLRAAIDICLPWERPGIAYAMASSLRRWGFQPKNKYLHALMQGDISLRLGRFPGKEITLLKPLKRWQKIFYLGNCQEKRILCLFGIKLASWKRPVSS